MAPSRMLAARFYGAKDLRVEEVELPALQRGEVRVKVAYAGICGSDLHEYASGPFTCSCTPHKLTGQSLPMTLGHEFSGTIDELGEGVDAVKFKVGSQVCIEPVISCLECRPCRNGDRALCEKGLAFYGYNAPGGLAPFTNVSHANLHIVPDTVGLAEAALAEPLSVAWHAVECSSLKKGDTALVIGAGPIGALVTRVLKARGAAFVAVSEPSATRGGIAKACGADLVLNPLETDVVKAVREATGGGVDIAIDCAGNQRTFDAACGATRAKARIVMVALWDFDKRAALDFSNILFGEKTVTASCCFRREDMEQVVSALASGLIRVDDLITGRITLKDIVEQGIEALVKEQHHVKILVDLSRTGN